jgi:hypothetical protein
MRPAKYEAYIDEIEVMFESDGERRKKRNKKVQNGRAKVVRFRWMRGRRKSTLSFPSIAAR